MAPKKMCAPRMETNVAPLCSQDVNIQQKGVSRHDLTPEIVARTIRHHILLPHFIVPQIELRTAHHRFLLRIIGFQRRQRTDHLISYAKALKKAQCESVETTVRKRRLLFAGGVQRTSNERLTRRVMFGTMAGGQNPGPSRPEKNWAQCLVDDIRVFGATEGSTESVPLGFGVKTVLWPTVAKKGGK